MRPVPAEAAPLAAVDAVLADGTAIRVRPVAPADEPALAALLGGLSDRSRWFRFFTGAADVEAAAHHAAAPGMRGLVALAGEPASIVGHALYVREGERRAEVAFEVADAWQGRGVGTILLGHVANAAAAEGTSWSPRRSRSSGRASAPAPSAPR